MKRQLLWIFVIILVCSFTFLSLFFQKKHQLQEASEITSITYNTHTNANASPYLESTSVNYLCYQTGQSIIPPFYSPYEPCKTAQSVSEIRTLLHEKAIGLNAAVIDKVLTTLKCANANHLEYNNILTIIDYSRPSNEKRLWIIDLATKKLLFHTYVSHGIKSGTLLSRYFSNQYNSKASSIGIYQTDKSYYGRHGLSLRLEGLDPGFNDNAIRRDIVMHGGWYVNEAFIKKYGRPGRSWGCPALPLNLAQPIINTIKERSLLVIYYPHDHWLLKSKFLNCAHLYSTQYLAKLEAQITPAVQENEQRETVLFASTHRKKEEAPILVMPAPSYEQVFHKPAPLGRMLRRQINHIEYIALSDAEVTDLTHPAENTAPEVKPNALNELYFVTPVIQMVRGYYATEMRIVDFGKIKEIKFNPTESNKAPYTVIFESKPPIHLIKNDQFIRWLGL